MPPLRRIKTKIGELLLQAGLISFEQLQQALNLQHIREKDKRLGQILVESGYVAMHDLYAILSVQCGYPYININYCVIEPQILSLIPEAVAMEYKVLPIHKIKDILNVAMVNPLDVSAIDQLQKITNSNIKVFLTSRSDLDRMFAQCYGKK